MPADGGAHYARRHADQRSFSDADQAEVLALRNGSALVDEGVYDDLVAGAMDDFESEIDDASRQEFHARDLAEDNGSGAVLESVAGRARALGELYPFHIENNQVKHKGHTLGWYEFMLACSAQKDISSKPFNRLPQLFERASAILSRGLLGPGAQSLHVGQPRDPEIEKFKAGFLKLDELTGAWPWKPHDDLPAEGPQTGDDGLDFVTWVAAGGEHRGHIFMVGQCACGDAWASKLSELQIDVIGAWTGGGEGWTVDPIRLFTTSHVLAPGWFGKEQKRSGIMLDRVRLCLLEASYDSSSLAPYRAEMTGLTKLALKLQ